MDVIDQDRHQGPPEISHHTHQGTRGLIKDRLPEDTGQVWTGSREGERRSDRDSKVGWGREVWVGPGGVGERAEEGARLILRAKGSA